MTVCLGSGMAGHIPQIDISNTLLECDLSHFLKCCDRGGREPCELVLREKPKEMEGVVGPQFLEYPAAHAPDHLGFVHIGRHHEAGHLKPYPLIVKRLERI